MTKPKNPNPVRHSIWHAPDGHQYRVEDMATNEHLLIFLKPEDSQCAVLRDPNSCAIAQAWMRQTGIHAAMIGTDKVYLGYINDAGERVAKRGRLLTKAKRDIDRFDETGEFPSTGVRIDGILPHERMDSKRQAAKRARERFDGIRFPSGTQRRKLHLRDASRRAQTEVVDA